MTAEQELIARAEAEEAELRFARMDHAIAWRLGVHLHDRAQQEGHALIIDLALGDQTVFHAALLGTSPHNDRWIERKKRTVREWWSSSYAVGLRFPRLDPPYALEDAPWIDPTRYSGSGGGFPIVVRGAGFVGTIAVSGLRHDLDHDFIVRALREFSRE